MTRQVAPLPQKLFTEVISRQEWQIVKYHETEVVKFDQDTIILDSGNWRTTLTLRRMNEAAQHFNLGLKVFQHKFVWWVQFHGEREPIPFYDGIHLSRDRSQPHPEEHGSTEAADAAAEESRYNGWSNRATWNVVLWLNNDQALYNRYRQRRQQRGDFTPKSAYVFCMRIWRNGKTPDGDPVNRANMVEVAAALNER